MSNNKQQTSVDWLVEQMSNDNSPTGLQLLDLIAEAKEMEKKQIIEAIIMGFANWDSELGSEQYYNETYGEDKL